jgi:hypothetical protein
VEPGPQTATGASWSNTASRAPARTSRTIATVAIAMLGVGVVLTTVFVWSNRSATPETGSPAVIASQPTGDARSSPVPPKVGSEKTVSAILPDNGRREGEPATSAGSSALSSADGPTVLPAPEAIPSARHELPATRADPSPITSKRRNDPVTESRAPVPSAAPPSTGPAPAPPSPVNSAPPVQRKNVYDERK